MKSTSIHSLNADRGLSSAGKIAYLFCNWLNNLFAFSKVDSRLEVHPYASEQWREEWDHTYRESSPGRRLSDLFWRTLPWEKIKEELGEIHVFDAGCGQGNYGPRLLSASRGLISSYVGIDAKRRDNWAKLEAEDSRLKFIESNSADVSRLIPPEANLFVSQSALEHFDEDLAYFDQIKKHIARTSEPVIQIHNFPAKAALPLYLFHGVRQYTPRTVSKITRLFDADSRCYLFGLGGSRAKRIQFKYFTWPQLLLRGKATWSEDLEKYDREVKAALEYDAAHPTRSPLFWVLIIQSNPKQTIW